MMIGGPAPISLRQATRPRLAVADLTPTALARLLMERQATFMALYRDRQSDDDRRGKPQADGLDNRWSIDEPAGRDQRDQRRKTGGGPQGPEDYERMNRAILRGTALIMAICLAFALPQADALIAPMFSGYLFAAAGAAMLWGLFTRTVPTAPQPRPRKTVPSARAIAPVLVEVTCVSSRSVISRLPSRVICCALSIPELTRRREVGAGRTNRQGGLILQTQRLRHG